MPKESRWEMDEMLNTKMWEYACVVDGIFYYYDYYMKMLRVYDPKQGCWKEVKGIGQLPIKPGYTWKSKAVSYGEKLAVFLEISDRPPPYREIWCVEVTVERFKGGEIWGKVERCGVVCDGDFVVKTSLAVMV